VSVVQEFFSLDGNVGVFICGFTSWYMVCSWVQKQQQEWNWIKWWINRNQRLIVQFHLLSWRQQWICLEITYRQAMHITHNHNHLPTKAMLATRRAKCPTHNVEGHASILWKPKFLIFGLKYVEFALLLIHTILPPNGWHWRLFLIF